MYAIKALDPAHNNSIIGVRGAYAVCCQLSRLRYRQTTKVQLTNTKSANDLAETLLYVYKAGNTSCLYLPNRRGVFMPNIYPSQRLTAR